MDQNTLSQVIKTNVDKIFPTIHGKKTIAQLQKRLKQIKEIIATNNANPLLAEKAITRIKNELIIIRGKLWLLRIDQFILQDCRGNMPMIAHLTFLRFFLSNFFSIKTG